jgi:hypothetical protein
MSIPPLQGLLNKRPPSLPPSFRGILRPANEGNWIFPPEERFFSRVIQFRGASIGSSTESPGVKEFWPPTQSEGAREGDPVRVSGAPPPAGHSPHPMAA